MRSADGQIFAITGICRESDFRPQPGDACRVHLGSAGPGGDEDPYLLVRRRSPDATATAVARIEWEGVFTVLADDDQAAEALFHDLLAPAMPEEVQHQWTAEGATLESFRAWRAQS